MHSDAVTFINSSIIGSAASVSLGYNGGRSVVAIAATQFGTGVNIQTQGINGKWIPICSSFIADQLFAFDAPAGQYRLVAAGSSIGLSASICRVST